MRKTRITYHTPIDALIALAKRLANREQTHGFSSDIFLDRYQNGELEDSAEFFEWAWDYKDFIELKSRLGKRFENSAEKKRLFSENRNGDPMKTSHLHISQSTLVEFCKKHHIRKLSLFGSILREDFGPESDVDVLVEFDPEHIPGLFGLSGMEIELSELLGRKADLRTPEDLSRYFREEVMASAELRYG